MNDSSASHTNKTADNHNYSEIPKQTTNHVLSEIENEKQRYVIYIEKEKQYISPLPLDVMFFTEEQLPRVAMMFMSGAYSIRKRRPLEILIRKWFYKLYSNSKLKRNYKIFLEKVRAENIKNNLHLFD